MGPGRGRVLPAAHRRAHAARAGDAAEVRAFLIVLDGVGIGDLPDADRLRGRGQPHVAARRRGRRQGCACRRSSDSGSGTLDAICPACGRVADPRGARGRMAERSPGKDSTTRPLGDRGAGARPALSPRIRTVSRTDLLERIGERVGRGWLGNVAACGTEIIARLGEEHGRTGRFIVYTSADSACSRSRRTSRSCRSSNCTRPAGSHVRCCRRPRGRPGNCPAVRGRGPGVPAHEESAGLLARAAGADVARPAGRRRAPRGVTVGKVDELFAGRGDQRGDPHGDNAEGEEMLLRSRVARPGEGLVFANLVDFDSAVRPSERSGRVRAGARTIRRTSLAEMLPRLRIRRGAAR